MHLQHMGVTDLRLRVSENSLRDPSHAKNIAVATQQLNVDGVVACDESS
jgi:hypothetical protein